MSSNQEHYVVTKKDRNGVFLRWLNMGAWCWNYETQQSGGVVLALSPLLRKIYPEDEAYKEAVMSHFSFFNTHRKMAQLILGAVVALEENHDQAGTEQTRETVTSIKTSLMGPFAGIGDSLLSSIPMTIFNAIAAYMALDGSPAGMLLGLAFGIGTIFLAKFLFEIGYAQGTKVLTTFAGKLKAFTNAANMLGITVVGGMIAANINIKTGLVFTQGEVVMEVQSILDKIMPRMLPVAFVILIYQLLGKKGMSTGKIILILMAIAFVGYNLHIFA